MHWLRWAVNTFKSASIDFKDWDLINGKRLCELNHDEFKVNVQGWSERFNRRGLVHQGELVKQERRSNK
jgi:hypothetical protein